MTIRDEVLKCVDAHWQNYRDVFNKHGMGAPEATRAMLGELSREQILERRSVPVPRYPALIITEYRRRIAP